MTTPISAFLGLREELFRYYTTPYRLRDENVQTERDTMLDREGLTWREPWIEPIADYVLSGQSLDGAVAAAGGHPELAEFARTGLITFPDIFTHQRDALAAANAGLNVVVTAGTGSGKTEAFLLPLFDALLRESALWSGSSPAGPRWWENGNSFVPQRIDETGRSAAVRALVLYPMNALVEDQLGRLRRSLDSVSARDWLDTNRSRHRFYFGRYTGTTPVAGAQNANKRGQLKQILRKTSARFDRWAHDEDKRYFLASVDGAEMRSRWDMQHAPPDILITNYSMLNIMLLREQEEPIIEQTRRWLESDENNVFHVIVDELHMYRGTAGTEVAYLIRNLLHRLGLHPDSPQVRFLATSASLGTGDDAKRYLAGFFGADPDTFEQLDGEVVSHEHAPADLREHAEALASVNTEDDPVALLDLLEQIGAKSTINHASNLLTPESGSTVSLSALDEQLFPETTRDGDVSEPMSGLMNAIELAGQLVDLEPHRDRAAESVPRLRTHLFFRNILGVWACADKHCPEVPPDFTSSERTVGRLYDRPRHRCECGSRVLRLLYCQSCGELYLQGFIAPEIGEGDRFGDEEHRFLVAELGELDAIPDQARTEDVAFNSTVYWPKPEAGDELPNAWTRSQDKSQFEFAFRPACFEPRSGRLTQARAGSHDGWMFEVRCTKGDDLRGRIPSLPIVCPHCKADWEIYKGGPEAMPITSRSRTRSPIRRMGTGYEKLGQVLVDSLVRELRDTHDEGRRRLVLFSDSRQDAAKLSAGLEKRHYEDLVREILVAELEEGQAPVLADIAALREHLAGDRQDDGGARKRLRKAHQDLVDDIDDSADGDTAAAARVDGAIAQLLQGTTILELSRSVESRLVELGINPAGPDKSVASKKAKNEQLVKWHELYRFDKKPVTRRASLELSGAQQLRNKIDSLLLKECITNVFAGTGRDLESLRLAEPAVRVDKAVDPPPGVDRAVFDQVVRASARILGDSRRFQDSKSAASETPTALRKYWEHIAERHGVELFALTQAIEKAWKGSVAEFLIQPTGLVLRQAGNEVWECSVCRKRHLDPAGGICTVCYQTLPELPVKEQKVDFDYYAHRAQVNDPFRLHCEELTGQTDRDDGPARQAHFQSIFLDDEEPSVDGIDLLSVTTTMEAGVDIGSLRGVVMSNMPPQRFNYQQRVGRAGRRRDPFSFALTLCRDRTHDEYYFANPHRITNEEPPPPYLDMRRYEILLRTASAEALRVAFRLARSRNLDLVLGTNTHGEFGQIDSWQATRTEIQSAIQESCDRIETFVDQLLVGADESLVDRRQDLISFLLEDGLLAEVDRAVKIPPNQEDLSQHLAECGVLPMFGFPTRVRNLYLRRPTKGWNWPPADTVDRDLSLAVIDFAPGSENVKDKQVHTSIGVAGYYPAGNTVRSVDQPLKPAHPISYCTHCGTVAPREPDESHLHCPVCGAPPGDSYREMQLAEPAGFVTDFWPDDFEGSFTRSARGSVPHVAPQIADMQRTEVAGTLALSGPGDIYVINDNDGAQYRFARVLESSSKLDMSDLTDSWVELSRQDDRLKLKLDETTLWTGAIGLRKRTDVLLIGPKQFPIGISREPFDPGQKGAWYSLGFLLRAAAARLLDVGLTEFDVGYSVRELGSEDDHRGHVEAFLADRLENGAGYATWLAKPENLPSLLDELEDLIRELEKPEHKQSCDSSCPDCLRDFTNLIFHPLLDWRLGRDLGQMLLGRDLDWEVWADPEEQAAAAFAEAFNGETQRLPGGVWAVELGNRMILVHHPLETHGDALDLTDRLEKAAEAAERKLGDREAVLWASSFDLDRRPGAVAARIGLA